MNKTILKMLKKLYISYKRTSKPLKNIYKVMVSALVIIITAYILGNTTSVEFNNVKLPYHTIEVVKVSKLDNIVEVNVNSELTRKEFINMVVSCYNNYNITLDLPLPKAIVVAQAGLESGWGKSRFFLEANNLFGVREFDLSKPHIKAKGAPNARWGIKVYDNYCLSIQHYMNLLSTASVYGKFQNELRYQYSIIENNKFNYRALLDSYASIYAEDPHYASKVVNTINKIIKLGLID